jgi:hypothetical protein
MNCHLLKAQVRFNSGNHHSFKVCIDITLKDLKDQLNEINQELNPGDTRRVEDLQYARPGYLQGQKIMLSDDDCLRTMFSRHYREHMFPVIEFEATLLRLPEDILNNLILSKNYV